MTAPENWARVEATTYAHRSRERRPGVGVRRIPVGVMEPAEAVALGAWLIVKAEEAGFDPADSDHVLDLVRGAAC